MSENAPSTPPVPPTPGEAAKVQPKKETVRIALPPKPTAAPTVRLPSPPPGAAPAPPVPPAGAKAAPVASGAAPSAAKPAPAPSAAPAAPAPMQRPMMASAPAISGLDKGLAIAAAIVGLAFLVHVAIIALGIQID